VGRTGGGLYPVRLPPVPRSASLVPDAPFSPVGGPPADGRRAFLTGAAGQDGALLAELLLAKGYAVDGLVRHPAKAEGLPAGMTVHVGDLRDGAAIAGLIDRLEPDEVYNLAAQSHVGRSFDLAVETIQTNCVGAVAVLEACRALNARRPVRVFQPGSSEMFGPGSDCPQSEETPFDPRSPYAVARVAAFHHARNCRDAGLFAVNGILFNHESPRRPPTFVTRKITRAAARIALGLDRELKLGNLSARRDWGYAPEYVEGMWRSMQVDSPDDYVFATGAAHSVREFLEMAFAEVNLDPDDYVTTDARHLRPAEARELYGDASKAKRALGWEATTDLRGVIRAMVAHDLRVEEATAAAS